MANLTGLAGFVTELRAMRTSLVNELRHVDAALSVLGKLGGGSTKPKRRGVSVGSQTDEPRTKGAMGECSEGIAASSGAAKTTGAAPAKRIMSASARRKIAAAQRARWAKVKAAKKTA